MPDEIEQALQHLGLTIIRPDEIRKTVEFMDCSTCFHYSSVFDKEMPLWYVQLLMIEYHVANHGDNN